KQYGHLESILQHAPEITKKRPREALLEHAENARLSKELVTIRDDLPVTLDLESLKTKDPDYQRVRDLYIELEFHYLANDMAVQAPVEEKPQKVFNYVTIDTLEGLTDAVQLPLHIYVLYLDQETCVNP